MTKSGSHQFPTSYYQLPEPKNTKSAKNAKNALAGHTKTVHATFSSNRPQETEAIAAGKTRASVARFDGNR